MHLRNSRGMALMEMMVALVIIMLMAYLYMKLAWKNTAGVSQETKKALIEQGIKTDNPQSIVQSAQETVDKANKKTADLQKQFGDDN